ncbi:MAG: hypothetical protein OEL76_13055, partial [Siculibacillus sp.]|nr:hypothetical protein [Siculibacillus sp.]
EIGAAASQIIRKNAGTAEEAAASISDVLGKLDADETIKRMRKEFGVDLPKALTKARKEGRNTFDTFLDITNLAIKGDLEKVNRIFGDKEARRGLTALMMYRDEYKKLVSEAKNAPGTVAADHAKKVGDAQAAVDRLANSASHAAASVGKLLDTMGASTALETFAKLADFDAEKLDRITIAAKGGKAGATADAAFGDRLGYLGAAAKTIGYYIDPKSPAQRYREDLAAAAAEDARRLAKAREEVARIDGVRSRYGSEPLPPVLQAQYDAARRVVDAPRNLGKRFPALADVLAPDREAADAASEIHRQRARMGLGRADLFALPTAKPLDFPTKLDDREIESEMQRMRARLQSNLDANPLVVRTRVDPVRAPLDTGRSFSGGDFTGAP